MFETFIIGTAAFLGALGVVIILGCLIPTIVWGIQEIYYRIK